MWKILAIIALAIPLFVEGRDIRPVIRTTRPSSFVVHPRNSRDVQKKLIITGVRLYPDMDPRFFAQADRVKVFLRTTGGYKQIEPVEMGGDDDKQTLTIEFSADEWLSESGDLEVQVVVDGMKSLLYSIPIADAPSRRARLTSVYPNRFRALYELPPNVVPETYYRFTIRGRGLDAKELLNLYFGNTKVSIDQLEVKEGVIRASIPNLYWNYPGTYYVRITTRLGSSNSLPVLIEEEPEEQEQEQG